MDVRLVKQKISRLLCEASGWLLTQATVESNLEMLEKAIREEERIKQEISIRAGILAGQWFREQGLTVSSTLEYVHPDKVKDWRVTRLCQPSPIAHQVPENGTPPETFEVVMHWDDVAIARWRFEDGCEAHVGYSKDLDTLVVTIITSQWLDEANRRNLIQLRRGK